ncbi:MAG TPA: phage tail protein [Lysobacter sp.]
MADIFNWIPTNDARGRTTARVKRAQFGDGYSQSVADGINHLTREWPLTFVYKWETAGSIVAFLESHAGQSFQWTPPRGTAALWQCDEWELKNEGSDVYAVTATFRQTFAP